MKRPVADAILEIELQHILPTEPRQMIILRVAADGQDQVDLRQGGEEPVVPSPTAFAPRRQIALIRGVTRETKAHWGDQNLAAIVEGRTIDPHPGAQTLARRVVERQAARMGADPRCLARHEKTGRGIDPQDRFGLLRQRGTRKRRVAAETTGSDGFNEFGESRAALMIFGVWQTKPFRGSDAYIGSRMPIWKCPPPA